MHILIAGGGIGGLAAALGLRGAGCEVTVFEQAEELREVGAGITLWANALKALDILGIGEPIRDLSLPELEGAIRTWDGRVLTSTSLTDLQRRYGAPSVALHRAELHEILIEAVGRETICLGRKITSFEQDPQGVMAIFSDGSREHGDFLIGADGIHSAVRTQLHGIQPLRYSGYTAWRAVIPFEHGRLSPGESWGRGARFGQVPLQGGRVYWFATQNTPAGGRRVGGEKPVLEQLFKGWHVPIPELIRTTPEDLILRNDIVDREPLKWWGDGRVTLLGDAAHPMTPNLGQGACQALEDAVVLSRCVRNVGSIPQALRQYERIRIPRTTALVRQSRMVGWLGQWGSTWSQGLREILVRQVVARLQPAALNQVVGYEV